MFPLFFFLLGMCIGSFLNVVIYRFNTGMSVNGRSQCFSCSRTLSWYDLIPVISFAAFRARCRTCKSKVSWQYPIVELCTAAIFLAVFLVDGLSLVLPFDLAIFSVLTVMVVYDIRHKIIPDKLVVVFVVLSLLKLFINIFWSAGHFSAVSVGALPFWDIFAGLIFFVPFWLLWTFSQGKWIGLGDGKLAIGIGAFLGLSLGLSAIMIGFWTGAIFGMAALFFGRNRLTMKSELPFAPFLILGVLIVFFSGLNVFLMSSFL